MNREQRNDNIPINNIKRYILQNKIQIIDIQTIRWKIVFKYR